MRTQELLDRISPEQRLLLQSTLCDDARALAAFDQWRVRVDIDLLEGESLRLLPLLSGRLATIARDDPIRARARSVYRHAWVKNQLILREAAALAETLQGADIPVVALKGAALLPHYGDQWGARPMYDVDLLVPTARAEAALTTLTGDGWQLQHDLTIDWVRARVLGRRHAIGLSRRDDLKLDLHWHVLASSLGPRADDAFWDAAVPFDLGDTKVLALDDADLVLHVLTHGARSAERSYLQWIADVTHVLRGVEPRRIAERLTEQARHHGVVATVHAALEAIERIVGDGLVEPLVASLARERSSVRGQVADTRARTRRLSDSVVNALDLDLVTRPVAYVPYVLTGRRAGVARAIRRYATAVVRTPAARPSPYELGTALDFTDASTTDRHASVGWWKVDASGLWSHGTEARLTIDLPDGDTDLELELELRSRTPHRRRVEVRANDTVVGTADLSGNGDLTHVVVRLPAEVARRGRQMELSFLAARAPRSLRRGRVAIQLARLTIDAAG